MFENKKPAGGSRDPQRVAVGPIQGIHSMKLSVLLRLRRFRDARIDPSRLPSTDGPSITNSCPRKNEKTVDKTLKTAEHGLT